MFTKTCVNESDVAAAMIIKLKEGCKLTQKAMSEVVNIADFTCNHVIHQAQGVVKEFPQFCLYISSVIVLSPPL